MATYSRLIRRLMISSLTVVISRALISPLLTLFLSNKLGLNPQDLNQKTVLNLARVAAHTVDRPAAPLTAYALGVAVGRGEPLAETAAKLQRLARAWPADD